MTTVGKEGSEQVDILVKESKTIKEKPHTMLGV